jgi:hypothetical protein
MGKIKEIAQKYRDLFEEKDGVWRFKVGAFETKEYEEISSIMHKKEMDTDFVYKQVVSALDWLIENDFRSIEEAKGSMHEQIDSSVDVYDRNLLDWLAQDIRHLEYLDRALAFTPNDAWQQLRIAQYLAIEEVYNNVLDLIEKKLKK